jgi:pyrroloquinoline-quinone synthase
MNVLMKKISPNSFREELFAIASQKVHWSTQPFNSGTVNKEQLKIHFRQEYAVYLRDFGVLLARILGMNPPWQLRRILATTIYEEETGGLSLGRSHKELFLQMMIGLGYSRAEFHDVELLAHSRAYREWLEALCQEDQWLIGAANLTIFVEGTANDREEAAYKNYPKKKSEIEDMVMKHPLVVYHGLAPEFMDLVRARESVEPMNRQVVYDMIVDEVVKTGQQKQVLESLETGLQLWLEYRQGIARSCGLKKP